MTAYWPDSRNSLHATGRMRPPCLSAMLLVALAIPIAATAQESADTPAPLRAGDIVAIFTPFRCGPQFHLLPCPGPGMLVKIEPSTGVRTTLSDFGDSSQGPISGVVGFIAALAVADATAARCSPATTCAVSSA